MFALNKKSSFFLILFLSLIVSFYFGEDSSGGGKHDYLEVEKFIDAFKKDFFFGIEFFSNPHALHLPTFYILIGNLSNIFGENLVRFFYLIISSLIPLVLYSALKKKYTNTNNEYLFLLSLVVFLSPYFRSSAVWLTTDNLALLFFLLSINSFFKFENSKDKFFVNAILCFLFLILASYIRQYYALFFIFYFIKIQSRLKFIENFYIVLFNLVCSIPVFIYLLFVSKNGYTSEVFNKDLRFETDFIFNVLIFTSLFLFYFMPFIFSKYGFKSLIELFNTKKKYIFIILILGIILFLFYNIPIKQHGGGMFYKISSLFNLNLFFLFSLLGSLLLYIFNNNNVQNNLIYLILIIAFPLNAVFQKYYDPLIYVLLLTLINSKFINEIIKNYKINLRFIYGYYLIFLISCNLYYI